MLRLRPTYEELLKETQTRRLRILPGRERRTQQGMLLENVDFDEFDLSRYDIRNPNKATQTDLFNENSNYSSASSNRSIRQRKEKVVKNSNVRQVFQQGKVWMM